MLLSTVYKALTSIINERLKQWAEKRLWNVSVVSDQKEVFLISCLLSGRLQKGAMSML